MKRKKHFAPAATSQEILDAVGVTDEERELVRKLLKRDLKKLDAALTPERIKHIMDETAKRRREEEDEAKKPPKTPVGTCVVCKHDVTAEYVHGLRPGIDHRSVPIGPGGKNYYGWNFRGYSCVECGLMYKFAPKPHKAE